MIAYRFISQDIINRAMTEFISQCNSQKLIGIESTFALLKIIQDNAPKGISIIKVGNQIKLQFSKPTEKRSKHSINEMFNESGLYNSLDKAYGVFNALKQFDKLSEFNQFFDSEIAQKIIIDDVVTVGKAIEIVKNNYFNSVDKCGRSRQDFLISAKGNWEKGYNRTFKYLQPLANQRITAKLLISFINYNYSHLGNSKGFKTHICNCQKLLIDSKLHSELNIFQEHFGKIQITKKQELQEISLEIFLEFRNSVLGLNGYELSKAQLKALESRQSWFKVLSINLIYGFRGSESLAIMNLDNPVTIGDKIFKALHDPSNAENLVILNDYYELTDDKGNIHKITIKTGNRIVRPMLHPDYPNLIEMLGIKDSNIKLPIVTPKHDSLPRTIKDKFVNALIKQLHRYQQQTAIGFTQTHSLRHLANHHGKLSGLTTEQRAKSLGHSVTMNDNTYNKHLSVSEQVKFLLADIEDPRIKVAKLETETDYLKQEIIFKDKQIADLKRLLAKYQGADENIIDFPSK